jgi:UDP-N-acetylmuramoyl-tripeptide--D-alanyl-D-alanine ligase
VARAADHWALTLHTPRARGTTLRMAGQHNVRNALAAAACALAAGVPLAAVAQGLEAFEPVKGRSQMPALLARRPRRHAGGRQLQRQPRFGARRHRRAGRLPGPRWLVLGDMGEVGDQGPQFHAEVGAPGRERGIDTCGPGGCAPPPRGLGGAATFKPMAAAAGGAGRQRRPAARGAGQGIALHEDGTGGAGRCAAARRTPMLLSLSQWLMRSTPSNWASCASSST